jgi:hypothetical protein
MPSIHILDEFVVTEHGLPPISTHADIVLLISSDAFFKCSKSTGKQRLIAMMIVLVFDTYNNVLTCIIY